MEYFGILTIIKVENNGFSGFPPLTRDEVKTVHYPDCQQTVIWLPIPANEYETFTCVLEKSGEEILHIPLHQNTFGLRQIIIDTLPIPPGKGRFNIAKNNQILHVIYFDKAVEVNGKTESEMVPDLPFTYRDGAGKPLPDEDLMMRQVHLENLEDAFISKLSFHSTGRDGYITYTENGKSARFVYEMGGGDCMIFILLPSDEDWSEATGFSLEDKKKIVDHLAFMTHRDYTGGARYTLENDQIIFYRK